MRFDADYYQRYYEHPATRVIDPEARERTVAFVSAYLRYLEIDVRSVLDIGCGTGAFKALFEAHWPGIRYQGVEASAYACERYGWTRGSAVDFCSTVRHDLVICYDVLQYLPAREAGRAINNLARLTGQALFFGVLTRGDWERACDQARTDGDVYLREAGWYRQRLAAKFINLGGGLFLPAGSDIVVFDLESLS